MEKLLKSKYGLLIFSLLCGLGYFTLIMLLIENIRYSYLLGIFFFPAVICGGALCIFKNVRALEQSGQFDRIKRLIVLHIVLISFAVLSIILRIFA